MACKNSKFKSAKELQNRVDAYFAECAENDKPLTISGLALFLGFKSRQSIYDYGVKNKDKTMAEVVQCAITYIESFYEGVLTTGKNAAGAIFWLKNHKWTDKHETELTGNITLAGAIAEAFKD